MTRKHHANINNQNARKYERVGRVTFTCEMDDKNRWVKQAQREGKTLTQWIIEGCNQRLEKKQNDHFIE